MKFRKSLSMAVVFALLGGCATTPALHALGQQQAALRGKAAQSAKPAPSLASVQGPYVAPHVVRYQKPGHTVSLSASGLPLAQALREVMPRGWALSFENGTHPRQGVDLDLAKVGRNRAIRQVAMAAGDVAVIRSSRQQVVIAKRATYLFKVPTGLINAQASSLSVSSSSSLSGGGGSGSSASGGAGVPPGAGGAPGSTSGNASGSNGSSFDVSGGSQTSNFVNTIKSLAGNSGVVSVDDPTGLVSVTAGAGGLQRVQSYIDQYARAANTKVIIHAAILEVQLTRGMSTGIKWNRILSSTLSTSLDAAQPSIAQVVSGASNSSFSITSTGTNLNGVIKALQNVTNVKVVTRPRLIASNGTPATIHTGTQVPYVGSIQSNVTGLSGTSTTGSSVSYANNGVSLSFIPQVLSNGWVQMAVVPSLSTIEKFDTFTVNGQTLSAPLLQQRQAFVRLLIHNGKTVILGGSISDTANQQTSGIPGLSRIPLLGGLFGSYGQGHQRSQLIILVRTKIVHPPSINPLIGESL